MIIYKYLAVLISLTAHEYFYYLTLYFISDKDPALRRKISLNPYRHFDGFGSFILPLLMLIINNLTSSGIPSFAYSSRHNLEFKKMKQSLTSKLLIMLSPSLINLLLALSGALALVTTDTGFIQSFLIFFTEINILLSIMNLIPLLPLNSFHLLSLKLKSNHCKKIAKARLLRFLYIFLLLETPLFSEIHAQATLIFTGLVKKIVSFILILK